MHQRNEMLCHWLGIDNFNGLQCSVTSDINVISGIVTGMTTALGYSIIWMDAFGLSNDMLKKFFIYTKINALRLLV